MVPGPNERRSFRLISIIVLLPLLWIHSLFGANHPQSNDVQPITGEPKVSIKIMDAAREIKYANSASYVIQATVQNGKIEEFFSISEIKIIRDRDGLSVYDRDAGIIIEGAAHLCISEEESAGIASVNGDSYRGNIHIFPNKAGKTMKVINQLGMESYLKGVIPSEMGKRQPDELEALKAQAVAARTYALEKLLRGGKSGVLENTILDMVYAGYDKEYELANEAVDSTAGEVIMFDGNLIRAYFFSTCGGKLRISRTLGERTLPIIASPSMTGIIAPGQRATLGKMNLR